MKEIFKKYTYKILWLAIFVYSFVFSLLSFKKYNNFYYNGFDLTIFNQVFYNTINGRLFEMTFNLHNYLADHFTPIIILLLPLYYFWQSPQMLLVIQSVVLALCAWPIYMITQKVIANNLVSLSFALLWLMNFLLHNGNLYEFHLLPFAIFFILWTFYFYYKKNYKIFLLFFALAILVREDIALLLLGFLPLSFLDKRDKKWFIAPILGLLYFMAALKIISFFNLGEENKFILYYTWLGGGGFIGVFQAWFTHIFQFIGHLLSFSNITSIFIMLISIGFLPLLAPRYLWLLAFSLLQFALTNQGINSVVYNTHYALIFLPGLFIASIFGIKKIVKNRTVFSRFIVKNNNLFISLFIFTIFYFSIFLSPVKNILFTSYDVNFKDDRQAFVNHIPQEASIVVSASLAPNLSAREEVYPLQYSYFGRTQFYLADFQFPKVDYILIDMKDMFNILSYVKNREELFDKKIQHIKIPDDFRKRLDDYILVDIKNDLLLWQNKDLIQPQENIKLYKFSKKDLTFNNKNFVVSSKFTEKDNYNILSITYQKIQQDNKNYLLRFYGENHYFDLPLDYGLLPPKDWSDDALVTFYYYLDTDIDTYQLFSWQGDVKIGEAREIKLDIILKPESNRSNLEDY